VTAPRAIAIALLIPALTACGRDNRAVSSTGTRPSAITISAADRPACALLFARLQRVTLAIKTSSELIAHSLNRRQLSRRIAIEQEQLRRSADLMAEGPIPAPLVAADRRLVSALRAFSRDFGRARAPAARGEFKAAAEAMTDPHVVRRIVRASKAIEDACK
jgi:hypothetical protein